MSRLLPSLRLRLIALISLAVLPLGLIAVQQSAQVLLDARHLEEQDILARTSSAAALEQELFREAFGAAAAIGAVAMEIGPDNPLCDGAMARILEKSTSYVFAGFITADGTLRCSPEGEQMNFSGSEAWESFIAAPRERLSVNREGAVSGQSVVIATVPVFETETGTLLGAAAVSVPHSIADRLLSVQLEGLSLALISGTGQILTASDGIDEAFALDALGIVPNEMEIGRTGITRAIPGPDGNDRLAAIVPLFGTEVFVLGLWDKAAVAYAGIGVETFAPLFPILMWLAALFVSIFAVERLVIRHLRAISTRMKSFSVDAPRDVFVELDRPTAELGEIARTYNAMVVRIVSDRAAVARTLKERELLILEIHHRVRNNLQLIASILNMQIRNARSPRETELLKRIQDRVMTLAQVHRALNDSAGDTKVRADRLVTEVLEAGFRTALPTEVDRQVEADEVMLDTDQSAALALYAAEAVAIAARQVGRPDDGRPTVACRLHRTEGGEVSLAISHTTGPRLVNSAMLEDIGLEERLIEGFAAQLGGAIERRTEGDLEVIALTFLPLGEAAPAPGRASGMTFFGAKAGDAPSKRAASHG